ncbi:MAG TPA: nucleoside transporter C-terminal domain-containing protein [Thermoanaerobaculia bacterium]|nr:nucleoside transporter C-terminal domain-containing protein [Thermoanaerobaculia bacterium]
MGLVGILLILATAYLFSTNRRAIRWRTILFGLGLQVLFAFAVLRWPWGQYALQKTADFITNVIGYAGFGARFVFSWLAEDQTFLNAIRKEPVGPVIFAFIVMPIVIFIASLFTILYHLGIMQRVVKGMAILMAKTMKTSGSESLASAANVFMGQTEAPIVIAPYIPSMTRSELLALMIGGMATVSGAVLGAYISLGIDARYLLTGSVMAAPASLLIAKLLLPETEESVTAGKVKLAVEKTHVNVIDAAASGAGQGAILVINIVAMLIAFIALISMLDGALGWVGARLGYPDLTLKWVFGQLFRWVALVMGVPAKDSVAVGELFGTKIVLNEFVAYLDLAKVQATISEKSKLIATFALCGFANFSSIGIQIGGIGGLAPTRKQDLARLGLRALLGGTLATFMTATVAGIIAG